MKDPLFEMVVVPRFTYLLSTKMIGYHHHHHHHPDINSHSTP